MKKLTFYTLSKVILLPVLFAGCSFLEVDPVGKTTIPTFFSDMDGIRAALPGTYSAMYSYYSSEFLLYPDIAGNMLRLNATESNMINQYNFTSDPEQQAETVGHLWQYIYYALANVNNIIEYQPSLLSKFPQHKEELNRYLAEALFLRALCHFDLCRVYAQPYNYTEDASHLGIPVLTFAPGATSNIGRSSVAQTYSQIINDLNEADIIFEEVSSREIWYPSRKAVWALKARVYLYMEQWDKVIEYSSLAINETTLSRADNYLDMYNNLVAGNEAILRWHGSQKTSSLPGFYNTSSTSAATLPTASPADTLIGLFDDNDIRLKLVTEKRLNSNGDSIIVAVCKKYKILANVTDENMHYDPFVLRASEMYLNRAEAYLAINDLDHAKDDLKAIISRALDLPPSEISLPTTKEELTRLLEEERLKELCFEGHNLWDITRRKQNLVREKNTNSTVGLLTYPNDKFILPIPLGEVNANPNIIQNPY